VLRVAVLVAMIAALAAASVVAWFDERGRPAVVRHRVVAAIAARHPGATGAEVAPGWLRVAMPSGTAIDVAVDAAYARCRQRWSRCDPAMSALADDVDAVQAAIAKPEAANVEAIVVAEAATSASAGYVSRALLGSLEARYAIVRGAAMAFLTSAAADSMGATRAQLAERALGNLQKRPPPRVVSIGDGLYRVVDVGEASSNLISASRLEAIARQVGATPLVCGIPLRGRLLVSRPDADAQAALAAVLARGSHETPNDPARAGIFACDVATRG